MDISKYLTNKDIQLSNEDINFEKLEKDMRKGYVLSDEVEKARKEALTESTKSYSELEEKYNKLEKSFNDMTERNTQLSNIEKGLKLQVEMVSQGFKKEDLDEVAKLRTSLFADEEDDSKAISMIKEKYNATYFPKNTVDIPNETSFNKADSKPKEINITRRTSIKDLIIK